MDGTSPPRQRGSDRTGPFYGILPVRRIDGRWVWCADRFQHGLRHPGQLRGRRAAGAPRTRGAIPICDEGCALREWLVVSGPEQGHVWLDHRADGRGLTPAWLPHHRRVTFGEWYLHWLDELEAGQAGDRRG